MQLFFRIGNNPNLAYAEIVSFLRSHEIAFSDDLTQEDYIVLNIEDENIDIQEMQDALGGTIKIGNILGQVTSREEFKEMVIDFLSEFEGKKVFGFSALENDILDLGGRKQLENLGMEIKKELGSARFVTSKEKELSSVIVKNEKLLRKGGDFNFIVEGKKVFIGVTKTVQDFKKYEQRDRGRPRADAKSGMLPLKVAQIMINLLELSDKKKDLRILDPFCGSGTILQELLVAGYENIIGADISEKAIDDSQVNLEWFSEEFNISVDGVQLHNVPAKELAQYIDSVDGIVTEPFLGPPQRGGETKEQLMKIKEDLEELYMRSFKTFAKILEKDARVVIVVPAFNYKNEVIYLDILNKLKSYGFVLQTGYKNITGKEFRYPLMYYRQDAKVMREIMVFEYKG